MSIPVAVLDVGSFNTHFGYANADRPAITTESVVGSFEDRTYFGSSLYKGKQGFISDMVSNETGMLDIDNFLLQVENLFETTHLDTMDTVMLFSFPNPTDVSLFKQFSDNIGAAIQGLFERFDFPALYFMNQSVLSAFSAGKQSATVIDMGYSGVRFSPVKSGTCLHSSCTFTPVGGKYMNRVLHSLLVDDLNIDRPADASSSYLSFSFDRYLDQIRKDNSSFLQYTAAKEDLLRTTSMKLPDGSDLLVPSYLVTESLFQPSILSDLELATTIPSSFNDCYQQCITSVAPQARGQLMSDFVICGGLSATKHAVKRVEKCVKEFGRSKIQYASTDERAVASWLGGAIVAGIDVFKALWITKEEFSEVGSAISLMRLQS
ncbi:hypothetical protein PCE1_003774 [Barthelona sp. PCE]